MAWTRDDRPMTVGELREFIRNTDDNCLIYVQQYDGNLDEKVYRFRRKGGGRFDSVVLVIPPTTNERGT